MSQNHESDRIVPMRVIVCGVQRTGTTSIQAALRWLGFNDCYHMHTARDNPKHAPLWVRATEAKYFNNGTFGREDWDKILGKCQAVCDLPAALFGAELAEIYPEAKVIILNRDPEKWYQSMLNSIYVLISNKSPLHIARMIYLVIFDENTRGFALVGRNVFGRVMAYDHGKEKEKALQWYHDQYAEYRKRIPVESRLEYNIQDGWEPLCKHLGVPIPMVKDEETGKLVVRPFPRVNDRADFHVTNAEWASNAMKRANNNVFKLIGKVTVTGIVGVVVAYGGYLAWQTRLGGRF